MALGEWGGGVVHVWGQGATERAACAGNPQGLPLGPQEGLPTRQSFVLSGTFLETDLFRGSVEESGL